MSKLELCKETTDLDVILNLTRDENPKIRLKAIQQICPCRVQKDIDTFWKRIFEMVDDPDAEVRRQILHDICDGSPAHLEQQVLEALEKFNHDSDGLIRRKVHRVMAIYKSTGKWNVL